MDPGVKVKLDQGETESVTTGIEVDDAIFKAFGLLVVSSQRLRIFMSHR